MKQQIDMMQIRAPYPAKISHRRGCQSFFLHVLGTHRRIRETEHKEIYRRGILFIRNVIISETGMPASYRQQDKVQGLRQAAIFKTWHPTDPVSFERGVFGRDGCYRNLSVIG